MKEILGAHLINDDDSWGGTKPGDMSSDTTNSKEMMTGSHITELHTHEYEELVPPELLSKVPNVSQVYDLAQKCQLDLLGKSKDLNMLLKSNNMKHTRDIDFLSQENQDYYNQHDQQFVVCKHDGIKNTTTKVIDNLLFVNKMVI